MCPPRLRKLASTKVERLSLTQAEVNKDANGTVYDTDPTLKKSLTWKAHFENAARVGSWIASIFSFKSRQELWEKVFGANTYQALVSSISLVHGQIFTLLLRWLHIKTAWGTWYHWTENDENDRTFIWFGLLLNCNQVEDSWAHWLARTKNGSWLLICSLNESCFPHFLLEWIMFSTSARSLPWTNAAVADRHILSTSSVWLNSCLCFTCSLWFISCNKVQMSFHARLNAKCHLRKLWSGLNAKAPLDVWMKLEHLVFAQIGVLITPSKLQIAVRVQFLPFSMHPLILHNVDNGKLHAD